jgi:hypothetical protein
MKLNATECKDRPPALGPAEDIEVVEGIKEVLVVRGEGNKGQGGPAVGVAAEELARGGAAAPGVAGRTEAEHRLGRKVYHDLLHNQVIRERGDGGRVREAVVHRSFVCGGG